MFTALLLTTLFFSIYPWIQVDYSEKRFWWTMWPIIGIASPFAFVGSILWATKTNKKFDEENPTIKEEQK